MHALHRTAGRATNGAAAALARSAPRERSLLVAGGVALLLALAVVGSGVATPVPAPLVAGAALFLFLSVACDVRSQRLPNVLTLPALVFALAASTLPAASTRPLESLAGAGLGLALLIAPYAIGGLGAGDVKALMALGAWLGPTTTLGATAWAAIAAGGFGLGLLAVNRELSEFGRRWGRNVFSTLGLRRIVYEAPAAGTQAAGGIPFAAALAVGLAAQWSVGSPW